MRCIHGAVEDISLSLLPEDEREARVRARELFTSIREAEAERFEDLGEDLQRQLMGCFRADDVAGLRDRVAELERELRDRDEELAERRARATTPTRRSRKGQSSPVGGHGPMSGHLDPFEQPSAFGEFPGFSPWSGAPSAGHSAGGADWDAGVSLGSAPLSSGLSASGGDDEAGVKVVKEEAGEQLDDDEDAPPAQPQVEDAASVKPEEEEVILEPSEKAEVAKEDEAAAEPASEGEEVKLAAEGEQASELLDDDEDAPPIQPQVKYPAPVEVADEHKETQEEKPADETADA
jgi:hypothetical protein